MPKDGTLRCLGACSGRWLAKVAHDNVTITEINHYVTMHYEGLDVRGLSVDDSNKRQRIERRRSASLIELTCSKCGHAWARLPYMTEWRKASEVNVGRYIDKRNDALYSWQLEMARGHEVAEPVIELDAPWWDDESKPVIELDAPWWNEDDVTGPSCPIEHALDSVIDTTHPAASD